MENNILQILKQIGVDVEESQFRFFRIPITVPNPTNANTLIEASAQLDRDFNRIVGIGYFEVAAGGIGDDYSVGARTTRQQWIDPININAWDANTGVPLPGKYYPVNIPYGSGDTFYAQVEIGATATSAAMSGQMVLILKRDLKEMPKG